MSKIFNTFTQLYEATILTGTPVRVLRPVIVDGMMEDSGDGLVLPSGNVFVPNINDMTTGRKTSLIDDVFVNDFVTYVNKYEKDGSGEWIQSELGLTSSIQYKGILWYATDEVDYVDGGYRIVSWSVPTGSPDILELATDIGTVIQFSRFRGSSSVSTFSDIINVKDYGVKGDGVTDDTNAFLAAYAANTSGSAMYVPVTPLEYLISEDLGGLNTFSFGEVYFNGGVSPYNTNLTPWYPISPT